eukprot:TRINITY_DN2374_c0_g1_i6.p2 TRINITY_DN2374_c0_g1~~TRINITY_DN2374_c0_g1_i6.p2  ORF type:complete len:114 (+),score=4.67 TRINITY_DN2374_c0_g1_i6:162-503(+)
MADEMLFPAHAGMNRIHCICVFFKISVPRARGDEPEIKSIQSDVYLTFTPVPRAPCSPRTRGLNRSAAAASRVVATVPLARGDEPHHSASSSPLLFLFPTHAGMNRLVPNLLG